MCSVIDVDGLRKVQAMNYKILKKLGPGATESHDRACSLHNMCHHA